MNVNLVIALISVVASIGMLGAVIARRSTTLPGVFTAYLALLVLWTLTSVVIYGNFFPNQLDLLYKVSLAVGAAASVSCYHLIHALLNRPVGVTTYAGYAVLIAIVLYIGLAAILGEYFAPSGILLDRLGISVYLLTLIGIVFPGMTIFKVLQGLKKASDPYTKNTINYLLLALSILVLFLIVSFVPQAGEYSLSPIGNLFNAAIIGYAILGSRNVDFASLIRRGLAYLLAIILIGCVFTAVIYVWYEFFSDAPFYSTALLLSGSALLLALGARPLRLAIQHRVDQLFLGTTIQRHREALLGFTSKMSNIIELEELANQMLPIICKALPATHANLLIEDEKGWFIARFAYPQVEVEKAEKLAFRVDSPIVVWLGKETGPLELKRIDIMPELGGLSQSEREQIASANLELMCPVKSRGRLVGILALGSKESGTYGFHDMQLIRSISGQMGLIIENARLYSHAVELAVTDGLTGLYNHRHFHKLIEQEIARCSRYAIVFSLIIADVDRFKAYNDLFGHLAGDKLLQEIAKSLLTSLRAVDTAFRYGGEEFAIILPETRPENAYLVAERIRKEIEKATSGVSLPVTASFGVASWPADGMTKEEVIARADAAMYFAKQTGRNKTCLSVDVVKSTTVPHTEIATLANSMETVYALVAAVEAKDLYTSGHSTKVAAYSVEIAEQMGWTPSQISTIKAAALLHDVGKIGIPDSVLNKKGTLNTAEWEMVKQHPMRGVKIVSQVRELSQCLPLILHHHERLDGSGFPFALQGTSIPLGARILTVVDAYDAMTSARPYREQPLTSQQALDELLICAGTQFDSDIVAIARKIYESGHFHIQQ